ncbi:unnamed protein product [Coregonus sp. 'balchen']|nr:unnamed protein product [Coregonus sp. 'balchen']
MFQSIPRRPIRISEISVCAVRLQSSYTLRQGIGKSNGKSQTTTWMGRHIGLLLSWLQRSGVGTSKKVASDNKKQDLLSIFANHCSFVTGQRLRRAYQIGELYANLYSERTRWTLVGSIWRRLQSKHASTAKLVAALAGVFLWEDEKVRDEELYRCGLELQALETVRNLSASSEKEKAAGQVETGWEVVMEKKNFKLDTEYRKKWDALVLKLEVVDRDVNTGSEVVHWATHFPYPMYSRDYVYVRRYNVDMENNLMVLISRAVQHPGVPETQDYVRVHSYQSKMVIRPHKSFDENGFDYLLTYSDDPQTAFPRYCVSWMVSSGMPDFLEKLHTAALRAKNLEVGIYDYASVVKSNDTKHQLSQDRLGDNTRPGHIYA